MTFLMEILQGLMLKHIYILLILNFPLNNQAKMFSPKIEGRLLDALNIKSHETVLEIGTGSGYLTAVVAFSFAPPLSSSLISTLVID
jgi:protein-L-isoaspartate O-methyltransferase